MCYIQLQYVMCCKLIVIIICVVIILQHIMSYVHINMLYYIIYHIIATVNH